MESPHDWEPNGPFEARYVAFLETLTQLRPSLHRYCARMTGSVVDGEDVVQEARIADYWHTPWVLEAATSVVVPHSV
jgi:DNA-directed RNA polymerase specialized sigma24 family protein